MRKTMSRINDEVKICLNCPFPSCKDVHTGCSHYKAEMLKISEKYRKEAKRKCKQ